MRAWLRGIVLIGVVVLGDGCTLEDQLIFHPQKGHSRIPTDFELAYEDIVFQAADGVTLHSWFIPAPQRLHGPSTTILWFHGNTENISSLLPRARLVHDRVGVSLFLVDYRGYGKSKGSPSEAGTYLDAEAALAVLRTRPDVDPARIVFYGRSIGSAVAVELATRHPALGLILESPFTSIRAMAKRIVPFLPLGSLLRTRYDSLAKISTIEAPILIIHGDRDEIVPFDQGRRLFEAAKGSKEFLAVPGAGHNDLAFVGGDRYYTKLKNFISRL